MHRIDAPGLQDDLMSAYLSLESYPEVPEVLSNLKKRGFRLAILPNGTPDMLEAAVRNSGIAELIQNNLSVEDVGIFKPDPRVYQIAVDRLRVSPEEIFFSILERLGCGRCLCFWIQGRLGEPVRPESGAPAWESRC